MHFFLQHRAVDSDIQQDFLRSRDEEQVEMDTSIILYPKKHDHYNQVRLIPLAMEIKPFLLSKKNKDDRACYEHLAVIADLLQLLYHSSIILPMLLYEN